MATSRSTTPTRIGARPVRNRHRVSLWYLVAGGVPQSGAGLPRCANSRQTADTNVTALYLPSPGFGRGFSLGQIDIGHYGVPPMAYA